MSIYKGDGQGKWFYRLPEHPSRSQGIPKHPYEIEPRTNLKCEECGEHLKVWFGGDFDNNPMTILEKWGCRCGHRIEIWIFNNKWKNLSY